MLDDGVGAIKAALSRAPEVKAGRVMSTANMTRFQAALEHLLEVARAAGLHLPGWTGEDEGKPTDDVTPDTTAPAAPAEVKVLTLADVNADLEGLGNFLH